MVEEFLREWLAGRDALFAELMAAELTSVPRLTEVDGFVQVSFESRPDARMWKDIAVKFARDLEDSVSVPFAGFYDLVADRWHDAASR